MTIPQKVYALLHLSVSNQRIIDMTGIDSKYLREIRNDSSLIYSLPLRVALALSRVYDELK